ncbi:hypothetical protein D3C72_1994790 [compost metagenome]
MPMARKITRIGIPRRDENELRRILAPTNTAPMMNKLLMVLASKITFSCRLGERRCARAQIPHDDSLFFR